MYVSGLIKDRIDVFEAVVAGKMGMRVCGGGGGYLCDLCVYMTVSVCGLIKERIYNLEAIVAGKVCVCVWCRSSLDQMC